MTPRDRMLFNARIAAAATGTLRDAFKAAVRHGTHEEAQEAARKLADAERAFGRKRMHLAIIH